MHSTLKAEAARPPRSSLRAQQRAFDAFLKEYNHERPHEALGQEVPASLYKASSRQYPRRIPEPSYPNHFETCVAYPNGVISFGATQWYVSGCLGGELIGLEEVRDGNWKVFFSWVPLGILDLRAAKERGARSFGLLVPEKEPARRRRRPYRR
jgi:hypothetical protein